MEDKIIIILVGLPARGKSFTSNNLSRFLNWCNINTSIFNSGDYRRKMLKGFQDADFFDFTNKYNYDKKEEISQKCFSDLLDWLETKGEIAIFDSTNSNKKRRKYIVEEANKRRFRKKIIFIELITNDKNIIDNNLQLKMQSKDYEGRDKTYALDDFKKRLSFYESCYQEIDDTENINYVKIINFTEKLLIKNIVGANESLLISYLMNLRLNKNPIYLTRHGQSINNTLKILGGDCGLTDLGQKYSEELYKYISKEINEEFIIYTSCLKRTIITSQHFPQKKIHSRILNEIHAGICENMTNDEIKEKYPDICESRKKDKLRFRYPEGESYVDLLERLRYFVLTVETHNKPILIVAHNAIIRVLLGYYQSVKKEDIPHLDVELGTVIKLTPNSVNYNMEKINLVKC